MNFISDTPAPPYFAVLVTLEHRELDNEYYETAVNMLTMAAQQEGYLGFEISQGAGVEIHVSYWKTADDIARWKSVSEHLTAQEKGRAIWYKNYKVRVCKVERDYSHPG